MFHCPHSQVFNKFPRLHYNKYTGEGGGGTKFPGTQLLNSTLLSGQQACRLKMVLKSIFKRFSPSVSMFAFRTTEQMRFSNNILGRDDLCQCLVSCQNLAFASPTYKRMKWEKAVFNCLCSLYTIQGPYIVPTHELVTRLHGLYPVMLCVTTSEHFCMSI